MNTNCEIIYVTCPDLKTAEDISVQLLQHRYCACTNMIPGMTSLYWWENKIERSEEIVLVVKTTKKMQNKCVDFIKSIHPNKVPCIICFDISGGSAEYLEWLTQETPHLHPKTK